MSLLLLESKLTNEGLITFWMFNLRYQIHIFDLLYLTFIFFGTKRYRNEIEKHPNKFLKFQEHQE